MLLHNLCCYAFPLSKCPVYRHFSICSMVACRSSLFISAQETESCMAYSPHWLMVAALFKVSLRFIYPRRCCHCWLHSLWLDNQPSSSWVRYQHPADGLPLFCSISYPAHLSDILHNEFRCLTWCALAGVPDFSRCKVKAGVHCKYHDVMSADILRQPSNHFPDVTKMMVFHKISLSFLASAYFFPLTSVGIVKSPLHRGHH